MKNKKSNIGLAILSIILIIALVASLSFVNLWYREYFEPKHRAIDREVWENSPARVEGAIQDIANKRLEYMKAEDDEKQVICEYLRNSYPDLTQTKVDDYKLWQFFSNCKYGVN